MPRRIHVVRPVQQHMGELVHESLHLCRLGHVLPNRHRPRTEVSETVCTVDHALMRHPQHAETLRLHETCDALPQPVGRFAFQQPR